MKVGIGYYNAQDAFKCGKNVSEDAIRSGGIERPDLVLAFCHGLMDGHEFYKGIRSVVGDQVPIIGGSAVGVITNEKLSYTDRPAGLAIIESDRIRYKVTTAGDLNKNEKTTGANLAGELAGEQDGKLLLVFYDSVKAPATDKTPPIMNASPLLLQGIKESLKPDVPIIGAGVLGDYGFGPTTQYCGHHIASQSVVGCMLSGDFTPYHRIMHGCTLKDGIYHTITKIEGPVIYEVDGKPVVEVINEIYGNQDWQTQVPVKRLTIGVNFGEKYGRFNESEYLNRLIMGVLPGEEGIVIFEPDLDQGTQIQFMLRDPERMMESARINTAELIDEIRSQQKKPVFGFYIDCAGRTASFSETLAEEAAEIQNVCNRNGIPLLGVYSGVEIAPLLGKSRGLDWTGVLMVLAEG